MSHANVLGMILAHYSPTPRERCSPGADGTLCFFSHFFGANRPSFGGTAKSDALPFLPRESHQFQVRELR